MISFHRPDFHSVLLRHLPASCKAHTSKRLVSYTQSPSRSGRSSTSPTTLYFQDGTHAYCDLLIGADGVKSSVRATLVKELASAAAEEDRMREAKDIQRAGEPLWSGTYAYRATIPVETLRARYPNHRVLTQPMVVSTSSLMVTVYRFMSLRQAVFWEGYGAVYILIERT